MTVNQILFTVFGAFFGLMTIVALFKGKISLMAICGITAGIFYYIVQYCPQYH